MTQEEGRRILLLREQPRKVDVVRLPVVLDGYLEVGHTIDAILIFLPKMQVSLALTSRRPGFRNLPIISLPLRNGIGNPVTTDTEAGILLAAVLPGGYREWSFEERVEVVYLLLGYGEGKRG